MYRNVVTEMYLRRNGQTKMFRDRNGQSGSARPKSRVPTIHGTQANNTGRD